MTAAAPPVLFQLAGHPLRWRLLGELALGDLRVRELTRSLGERQSLISYHLRRLRAAGVVSARRSAADGRDAYYRLDLERCGDLLAHASAALHPGLRLELDREIRRERRAAPARLLFLCTGNSARSQIAAALSEQLGGPSIEVVSAGSRPKSLHANAVRVMGERGVDISQRRPTHLRAYRRRRFDYVISLCDRVREVCPEFPGGPRTIHWSVADPAAEPGSDVETYPAFERTATELETRIRFLLHMVT